MLTGYKIIEFVGPPCSGKSSIAKSIFKELMVDNVQVLYLEKRPENFSAYYGIIDKAIEFLLFFLVFFYSLFYFKIFKREDLINNIKWIRRLCREWGNSIICRRFINSVCGEYDVILADHCLGSMFIFEIADPRNVAGLKLWKIMELFMTRFPLVDINCTYYIYAKENILIERSKYKNKIVRKDLSETDKKLFFINAFNLVNLLKRKENDPYFKSKSCFIDTSNVSLEKITRRILKVIRQ